MQLHSSVDLTGNVNMIEKLVKGGTGTGDLPILSPTSVPSSHADEMKVKYNQLEHHFKMAIIKLSREFMK